MAQALKIVAVICLGIVSARLAAGQCSGAPEVMQCNVPYWCNLRVGGFPLTDVAVDDCKCYQLCQDAKNQGQGSRCVGPDPDGRGGSWYRIIFDRYDGNNNYRGTVMCDPRGPHGRKLMSGVAGCRTLEKPRSL